MRKFLTKLNTTIKILTISYLFLTLCNWDFNVSHWNGLSHVMSACMLFISYVTLTND